MTGPVATAVRGVDETGPVATAVSGVDETGPVATAVSGVDETGPVVTVVSGVDVTGPVATAVRGVDETGPVATAVSGVDETGSVATAVSGVDETGPIATSVSGIDVTDGGSAALPLVKSMRHTCTHRHQTNYYSRDMGPASQDIQVDIVICEKSETSTMELPHHKLLPLQTSTSCTNTPHICSVVSLAKMKGVRYIKQHKMVILINPQRACAIGL